MVSLPKPDVILTHESDLDGLVSGVLLQRLARKVFDTEVRLAAYHYNTWRQREPKESAAWVCDLSFEARLDKANWLIVDHHATEVTPKKAQLVHDLNKSAGLLCYELCRDHELASPELDRLGFEWSKQNVVGLSSTVGYVDTVIGNNNLIVHQLLERGATPYPVLLTLFRRPSGMIIASLRSRNGEALKVAEKLQGGGHANACGATLPKSIRTIPDAIDYLRQIL